LPRIPNPPAASVLPMKRFLTGAACAVLTGAGLVSTAAPAWACPYGTVPSDFGGVCVSGGTDGDSVSPATSTGTGAVMGGGIDQLPSVNGIPCTPQQLGTCIGLMESEGVR